MYIRSLLIALVAIVATGAAARADYYSPTLSAGARLQHEFRDVQRQNYPTGPAPAQDRAANS